MPNLAVLSDVMLSIACFITMLSVVMLRVITLSVVMLSVLAPLFDSKELNLRLKIQFLFQSGNFPIKTFNGLSAIS
jgi:hypothetical protein